MTILFVYGTLKRGGQAHQLVKDQKFLGEARTKAIYRLYDTGSHPVLVEASSQGRSILGELWAVDDERLVQLDLYEEVPHLFERRAIELEEGTQPAEAYFYLGDVAHLTDCGDRWP